MFFFCFAFQNDTKNQTLPCRNIADVWEGGGPERLVGSKQFRCVSLQNRGVYMFRIDSDAVIDATMAGGPARYINHSCSVSIRKSPPNHVNSLSFLTLRAFFFSQTALLRL